jgi:hypothetical protein
MNSEPTSQPAKPYRIPGQTFAQALLAQLILELRAAHEMPKAAQHELLGRVKTETL